LLMNCIVQRTEYRYSCSKAGRCLCKRVGLMVRLEIASQGRVVFDEPEDVTVSIFCVGRWALVGPVRWEGRIHRAFVLHDSPPCQAPGLLPDDHGAKLALFGFVSKDVHRAFRRTRRPYRNKKLMSVRLGRRSLGELRDDLVEVDLHCLLTFRRAEVGKELA